MAVILPDTLEKKKKKRNRCTYSFTFSSDSVTLTLGQGLKNRYGSVKLKGGFHQAKLEVSCLLSLLEKVSIQAFATQMV